MNKSYKLKITKSLGVFFAALCLVLLIIGDVQAQVTFVVNSTGDDGNEEVGDGFCNTGTQIGTTPPPLELPIMECTLRAAIEEANEADEAVIIEFGSSYLQTNQYDLSMIVVQSNLPFIQNQVTIAGETHLDFEEDEDHPTGGHPRVVISGSNVSASGLRFGSGSTGSAVRHIAVGGFGNSGILLQGGNNYTVENSIIGGYWSPNVVGHMGNGEHGINVNGASETGGGNLTTIFDNIIFNNSGDGIHIRNGSEATIVQGNIIGLTPSYLTDIFHPGSGNAGAGVYIAENAGSDNIIGFLEGNTISNNGSGGVHVLADGQSILGNDIGVPHNGEIESGYDASDYGNDSNGIILESSNNTVGGTGAATNTIGNSQYVGIRVGSGGNDIEANDNEIRMNYIGTNADGDDFGQSQGIRIDNGSDNNIRNVTVAYNTTGIEFRSGGNVIRRSTIVNNTASGVWFRGASGSLGTDDLDDANVIGENNQGVYVSGNATNVYITNNYIGTNEDGDDLGNSSSGVRIDGENTSVAIGQPGHGNVIGNNHRGIDFRDGASGTYVFSNYIGVHPNGDPISNMYGIIAANDADVGPNQIGYPPVLFDPEDWEPGTGPGNIIAHNTVTGVDLSSANDNAVSNVIRGNSFYGNGSTGIDLGMDNVDVGGGSSGPNTWLNFPEFDEDETFYNENTGEIELRYRVRTNAGNADYGLGIDVYLAQDGERQGKTFLGTVIYEEDNATNWVFDAIEVPAGVSVSASDHIVATATDNSWNTSQFSEAVKLGDDPEIVVSTIEVDFSVVSIGDTDTYTVEIKNEGESELSVEVTLANDGNGVFSIASGDGNFALDPSEDMEVIIEFTPDAEGEVSGLLEVSHNAGNEDDPVEIALSGNGVITNIDDIADVPQEMNLDQNYPNPFNPVTQIRYQLNEQTKVTLEVYNLLGEHITTLVHGTQSAGWYEVSFDGSNLSSGTYIYRLEAGDFVETKSMILVK